MAEYIEREALLERMATDLGVLWESWGEREHYVDGFELAMYFAESAPAADVVEVVRCKDCVHGTLCENRAGADYVDCALDDASTRLLHDFCSYGERRGEE